MKPLLSLSELIEKLPPPWPEDLGAPIRAAVASQRGHKIVVLDDDPTGTQTVHDVPVLTVWDVETLRAEFAQPGPCFYLLTNSRGLAPDAAALLNREIAGNLRAAAAVQPGLAVRSPGGGQESGRSWPLSFTVISRSDSTLRGHFPLETDVLAEELGPFDATILVPYFEAGGRYTIGDVHYVADGDRLVPAAETSFAKDAAFGYRHSNLREWVEEKTGGRVRATEVISFPLERLRRHGPAEVAAQLRVQRPNAFCVVNAVARRDLEVFVAGLLEAERSGKRFLFRTAAEFVAARLGMPPATSLSRGGCGNGPGAAGQTTSAAAPGGLIVVGSYVPKTTEQLNRLQEQASLVGVELDVGAALDPGRRETAIGAAVAQTAAALAHGRDVVVFTSRRVLAGGDAVECLDLGRRVSDALATLVQQLPLRPRFLIAKGGITSSDLATRALGVRRAVVLGQLLPGVPVWRLGPETRFPGLEYVVFPGNVGDANALLEAWRQCSATSIR